MNFKEYLNQFDESTGIEYTPTGDPVELAQAIRKHGYKVKYRGAQLKDIEASGSNLRITYKDGGHTKDIPYKNKKVDKKDLRDFEIKD